MERGRNDKEAGHVSPSIFEVCATEGEPKEWKKHQLLEAIEDQVKFDMAEMFSQLKG